VVNTDLCKDKEAQKELKILKSLQRIPSHRYFEPGALKPQGLTVDFSNDPVDIKNPKMYRCSKIITTGQILH